MNNMPNDDILLEALEAFQRETDETAEKIGPIVHNRQRVDANLRIANIEFRGKIVNTLNPIVVGQIANRLGNEKQNWLLVTKYVNTQLARILRELHIQFIDTAGNAFIRNQRKLIYLRGNKPQQKEPLHREKKFGRAMVQVVFALLCKKELCNAPYRDIGKQVNVALGTVAGVMNDLETQGFLVEHNEQRHLIRKNDLFDRWVRAYAEKLRPKTLIGRYHAPNPDILRTMEIDRFNAQWGGEAAANRLTGYLQPEITTIYTRKPLNEIILHLKLHRDPNGNVELRERFWQFDEPETGMATVPPLLVYADLIATGNTRNIETAKVLYDDHLQGYFRQN